MKVLIGGHPQIVTVAVGKEAKKATTLNPHIASQNRMKKRQRSLAHTGRR